MLEFFTENLYTRVDKKKATKEELTELHQILSVRVPGYYFSQHFRRGLWDGYRRFFNLLTSTFFTGLLHYATARLQSQYKIIDNRVPAPHKNLPLELGGIELRDYQKKMVSEALTKGRGIISAPPNAGKTEVAAGITQVLGLPTLFLTHRLTLLHQTQERFEERLGTKVGLIGGGIEDWNDNITVASVQTVYRKLGEFKERLKSIPVVFVDECHHVSAKSFEKCLKVCEGAFYRYGLCLSFSSAIALPNGKERKIGTLWYEGKREIEVLSYNCGIIEPRKATIIRIPYMGDVFVIGVKKGNGECNTLTCSPYHKLFVESRGFVQADSINVGDTVKLVELPKNFCKVCGKEIPSFNIVCGKKCRFRNWQSKGAEGQKRRLMGMTKEERGKVINWRPGHEKRIEIVKSSEFREKQGKRIRKYWHCPSFRYNVSQAAKKQMGWLNESGLADKGREKRWGRFGSRMERYQHLLDIGCCNENFVRNQIGRSRPPKIPAPGSKYYSKFTVSKDGHKLVSKVECKVDNWFFENGLEHIVHPNIPGTDKFSDFLIKGVYVEVDGLGRGNTYDKYELYRKLNLPYVVISDFSFSSLHEKLGFLLVPDPEGEVAYIRKKKFNGKVLYDLNVEGNHNFFANGILVHNSATPLLRDDINNMIVRGLLGDEIVAVTSKELIDAGISAFPSVYLLNVREPRIPESYTFDQAYEEGIVYNEYRNKLIVSSAKHFLDMDKSVFILVWRIAHGEILLDMLSKEEIEVEFISGGDTEHTQRVLKRFSEKELKCVVSSTISDEGLDVPAMDVLIIATGFKAPLKTIQRVGRGLRRKSEGENVVSIVDFVDSHNRKYLYKHSVNRAREYVKMDIKIYEVIDDQWRQIEER